MTTPNTSVSSYLTLPKSQSASHVLEGFTLVELITATAIFGVVSSIAWGGLITLIDFSQSKAAEIDRKHELIRAADFIADDIRSGAQVAVNVTMPNGPNQGLFEIRDKAGNPLIAYYVTPRAASRWRGPYVIKRKIAGHRRSQALVDGISDDLSLECLIGSGETKHKGGVKVSLQSSKSMKICLVGQLSQEENFLSVTRQVNVRN